MYKFFTFSKKISIFVIFILVIVGFPFNKVNAITKNPNNQINITSDDIQINIPTENIKHIPIIGYKLIYETSYASLVDFLDDKIQNLVNKLSQLGIKSKNVVIIYLDYEGDNSSQYTLNQFSDKPDLTLEELTNYTTEEGVKLNLSYICNKYSLPFLLTKRKILFGTLVNDNTTFNGNDTLNVMKFNIPDAMGFQTYIENNQVNTPTKNNTSKNFNVSKPKYIFGKEEIIINRCAMIQYMNLSFNNKTKFIGMMQYYDKINNMYAYFSVPGILK